MKPFQLTRLFAVTMGLLVMSVAVNVVQAGRIRSALEPRPTSALGHQVGPISVVGPDGQSQMIRFEGGLPTVLYYFSSTCSWCERNWDNVRALAAKANGRYRVVAVSSETSLDAFIDSHSLPFEVYGGVPDSVRWTLSFGATPRTVVISPNGTVSNEWDGAYRGSVARAIESTFDLHLPGVAAPPAKVQTASLK